jgi:cell division transport system permease protein
MATFQYAFDEAIKSLWRGRSSGALSTATIALALIVFGSFLLVTANLSRLGEEWSNAAEMSVYLRDDVDAAARQTIETALASDVVAGREYVSKAEALSRFRQTFGDMSAAVEGLGENPMPASYELRLKTTASSGAQVDQLAVRLRQQPGVVDVRYDRQWLTRLLLGINLIRAVGLILGSVLTIAAALTVANVVRLALYSRRDEIDIMHLVGAPQSYIRGPFVMEGVLQGGMGAVAALVVLALAFAALRVRYADLLSASASLTPVSFLSLPVAAGLVIGGMTVGCVGGLIASWSRA